jgi:hypothetical protein
MARRTKPGSRQSRQRRRQHGAQPRSAAPPSTPGSQVERAATPSPVGERPTATGGSQATSMGGRPAASVRGARANPRLAVAGPSRLTERAAEEYHHVLQDLRNIGVLAALMLVVLLIAVVIFNLLKIGQGSVASLELLALT